MEGKWTKGPWTLVDERDLTDAPRWAIRGADGRWVMSGYFHTSTPQEANARLIAQAPAMAEALESLLSVMEHCTVSAGCCMCGDDMTRHPSAMVCGHEPVDMGAYHADAAYKTARALLTAIKGE